MTLPSTKRPREVEEEMAARLATEKVEREKVIFRTSKVEIFQKTMTDWYKSLNEKRKRHLTPVALKRKAICVCYANDMVYDRLPLNWVTDLETQCNLKLYRRKRVKKNEEDLVDRKVVKSISSDSQKEDSGNYAMDDAATKRRRSVRALSPSLATTTSDAIPRGDNENNKPTKQLKKRFLDLSSQPPPPVWLESYSKGIVLPRVLTMYSTEDTNILFYDYAPKIKDSFGREIKMTPQPRISLDLVEEILGQSYPLPQPPKRLQLNKNK